jgi:23S rRNA pseudouridine2604 synthase
LAVAGDKVLPGEHVYFQGREVQKEDEMILLVMNKPVGIVCTAEKREKNNVIDFLHYPKRVYPVGRLDKDSEGLLLLTNNGDIVNKMMRAGNRHEKEYIVTVNRPVSDSFLRGLAGGVPLVELGATTRKCRVEKIASRQFRIILTQGLNRQIRRMCEYFGYRVEKLVRVRIMNIELGDLKPGEYRAVTGEEYQKLLSLIRDSSNLPASQTAKERHKQK